MRHLLLAAALVAGPAAASDLLEPRAFWTDRVAAYEHGLAVPAPKGAIVRSFSAVDTNHNHVWDAHEIVAAFGSTSRDVVLTFDANGDGRITPREIRAFDDGRGGPDGVLFERASR